MKRLFIIALTCSAMLTLPGCALHMGYMNDSASLEQDNFTYDRQVTGSAEATYILGIGGLDREALVYEARTQMLEGNPLKANQVLANTTINWKTSFYIVFSKTTCTVTADVVEFED